MKKATRYNQRGVSSSKTDVHHAIRDLDKGLFPNAFCKILPDLLGGDDNYCNVMHADGAGTKSSLAYMYWKETGDYNVWKGIAHDSLIMNIDDLICVGATDNILLSSTVGRNKMKIPGDVIVGLASFGQAIYEKEYNGGIGSNGLTSARHDIFSNYLADKYPESYDDLIPKALVYNGHYMLTQKIENLGTDAGKLLLSPTRTYAPVIRKVLEKYRSAIHGMIHCSGGGQTKVMKFADNLHIIKDNMF